MSGASDAPLAGGALPGVLRRAWDSDIAFAFRRSPTAIAATVVLLAFLATAAGPAGHDAVSAWVLVGAIGLSGWVQYARVVRGATLAEKNREYVQAARLIGLPRRRIVVAHILPNVLTAVPVLATIQLAVSI